MLGLGDLLISAVVLLVTYVFIKWWKLSNFFIERGIPYVKPIWPLGSDVKGMFLMENGAHAITRMYNQFKDAKIFGFYQLTRPVLVIRDPEYIQNIYTTDFSHFVDRLPDSNDFSPLESHLFLQRGAKWRYLRAKLSPIFTSGKLKWMYGEMRKCVDSFTDYLKSSLPFGKDHDIKEDTVGFTTEVISSCAFGIDAKSIGNPDSDFRQFTRKAFAVGWRAVIMNIIRIAAPAIARILKLKIVDQEVEDWVLNLVKQSFDHRLKTGYVRNDFIQLLLQLREKGSVEFDDNDEEDDKAEIEQSEKLVDYKEHHKEVLELNDGVLGAQLFVFLIAGFETTSSTIYHLIYLFSLNQEPQKKAREEIRKALAKHGDYTYEMVKDLKYLGHCVDETLRLFPPVPFNFRTCTKDYTFPDGTTMEKGRSLFLPTYSIQHDAKYFPEPEKFIPERFEGEIVKGTYSPFGDGPRICIGKRFALMEIMLAMSRLLIEFQINPGMEQKDQIVFSPRSFLLSIKDGVKVQVEKL